MSVLKGSSCKEPVDSSQAMQSEDKPSASITLQHMADWYSVFVGYQQYLSASAVEAKDQDEKTTLLSLTGTIAKTYLSIVSARQHCFAQLPPSYDRDIFISSHW